MAIAPHECKPGCYHGSQEISLGVSAYPKEMTTRMLLSNLTMAAIQAEAIRAHARHGINSMLYGDDDKSLRILMEEVGEVAREMNELALGNINVDTYNKKLVKELIQVAAMAATWIEKIEGNHND
jgi:NTP pyrophosphatase (non-canonical NTP hydrolase)